ncbi:MAG: hypothetical protein RBR78_10805 [Flavobacteriaceae bacterium]|jgi:phospho-2-dehydro-3-deoxyheptonate aldolase|nr:hypothetical protein [Flavobacteriaceae bacterium]
MKIAIRYQSNTAKKTLLAILTDGTELKATRFTLFEQSIYINNMLDGFGSRELVLIGDCEIIENRDNTDYPIRLQILKDTAHDLLYLVTEKELKYYFTRK